MAASWATGQTFYSTDNGGHGDRVSINVRGNQVDNSVSGNQGTQRNFYQNANPSSDSFAIESFDFGRGPNSALFGNTTSQTGGLAGIQSSQTKQARKNQTFTTVGFLTDQYSSIRGTIDPGDKMVLPEPSYVAYPAAVIFAGGTVRYVPTRLEDDFALDPAAVGWAQRVFGVPCRDTWWQTETGAIMIANGPRGGDPAVTKPGALGRPLSGIEAAIVSLVEPGDLAGMTAALTPAATQTLGVLGKALGDSRQTRKTGVISSNGGRSIRSVLRQEEGLKRKERMAALTGLSKRIN